MDANQGQVRLISIDIRVDKHIDKNIHGNILTDEKDGAGNLSFLDKAYGFVLFLLCMSWISLWRGCLVPSGFIIVLLLRRFMLLYYIWLVLGMSPRGIP